MRKAESVYAALLFVLALVALPGATLTSSDPLAGRSLALAVFFLVFGLFTISTGYRHAGVGYVSFDRVAQISCILVLGPIAAAWVNGLASLLYPWHRLRRGEPWQQVLVVACHNAGLMALLTLLCGGLYVWVGGAVPQRSFGVEQILALTLLVLVMQVLNDLMLLLDSRISARHSYWPFNPFVFAVEGAAALCGILVAIIFNRMEPAVIVLLLIVLAAGLLALTQFARMRNRLEEIVNERTAALENQFRKVRALEREQVPIRERERLMRDMHDGIGGHLVSTLTILEQSGETHGRVAEAVQGALHDLRLIIDSLDPIDGDLNAVLAMFRDRIEPRLRAAGVTLRWQVGDLPQLAELGPSAVLSILRIPQETVTNTLKHAQAREIMIDADVIGRESNGEILIRVRDDGRGFDVASARGGRGLGNLAQRAAALGGRLEVDSGPEGTGVSLNLPAGNEAPQRQRGPLSLGSFVPMPKLRSPSR